MKYYKRQEKIHLLRLISFSTILQLFYHSKNNVKTNLVNSAKQVIVIRNKQYGMKIVHHIY